MVNLVYTKLIFNKYILEDKYYEELKTLIYDINTYIITKLYKTKIITKEPPEGEFYDAKELLHRIPEINEEMYKLLYKLVMFDDGPFYYGNEYESTEYMLYIIDNPREAKEPITTPLFDIEHIGDMKHIAKIYNSYYDIDEQFNNIEQSCISDVYDSIFNARLTLDQWYETFEINHYNIQKNKNKRLEYLENVKDIDVVLYYVMVHFIL